MSSLLFSSLFFSSLKLSVHVYGTEQSDATTRVRAAHPGHGLSISHN